MKFMGFGVIGIVLFSQLALGGTLPPGCEYDKECIVDIPGAVCADGTPSFVALTVRQDAPNLLVYMNGGGACWDRASCKGGYANPLTRVDETYDWNKGSGIYAAQDPKNPFGKYSVARIPYCTGDIFSGKQVADYSADGDGYQIRHMGYENVEKSFSYLSARFPTPEKAVLFGCSAGGIGVYYHLRNFAKTFPDARKYAISDAGTPFKAPHISGAAYQGVMTVWGALGTLPVWPNGNTVEDSGALLRYNAKFFPEIRFGFISSYRDKTMAFFAKAMGAPDPLTAVAKNIIDIADNDIGRDALNQKVFYLESETHCYSGLPLGETKSLGHTLGDWMHALVSDSPEWKNVRPDLAVPQ